MSIWQFSQPCIKLTVHFNRSFPTKIHGEPALSTGKLLSSCASAFLTMDVLGFRYRPLGKQITHNPLKANVHGKSLFSDICFVSSRAAVAIAIFERLMNKVSSMDGSEIIKSVMWRGHDDRAIRCSGYTCNSLKCYYLL